MAKSFTEIEKENIQEKLMTTCEENWAKFGYKKTNIDELCAKAGISKGAFYLFYNSKEELFCDTLGKVQNRLYALIEKILQENQSKDGMAQALKAIYREYDKSAFLYNFHSLDFISFTNKLSKEQQHRISQNSINESRMMLNKPYLKMKIHQDKAMSILTVLLSTITCKENVIYNHFDVFDFLIDNVIGEIFE